ncbi:MAG: hypothetical protein K1X87_02550 [Dehalococcoidia bacterium]|nr:hypothetical protein [Dehalococcoidia bacterium]
MAQEITVGAEVVTADGRTLGKVKTVQESAFQVDAPRQFDYWLEATLVKASSAERLELAFNESDLGGYKMDRPFDHNGFREGAPQHLHPDSVRDSFLR